MQVLAVVAPGCIDTPTGGAAIGHTRAGVPAPGIGDDGSYVETDDGRPIRWWTRLDNRLMLEDLWAMLASG